jgi:dTDP-4-amino-4,6-dideoxygalactose transaminase
MADLRAAGVEVVRHYTPAIHHQPVYTQGLRGMDRLPVTERLVEAIVSLPVAPELTDDDIGYVIRVLRDILS